MRPPGGTFVFVVICITAVVSFGLAWSFAADPSLETAGFPGCFILSTICLVAIAAGVYQWRAWARAGAIVVASLLDLVLLFFAIICFGIAWEGKEHPRALFVAAGFAGLAIAGLVTWAGYYAIFAGGSLKRRAANPEPVPAPPDYDFRAIVTRTVRQTLAADHYTIDHAYDLLRDENDAALAEAALLELLSTSDPSHSSRAARALALRHAVHLLPEIKARRQALAPYQSVSDYRRRVDEAITMLEQTAAGVPCHCPIYAECVGKGSPIPAIEQHDGFVRIISTDDDIELQRSYYTCRCLKCGRMWRVEENPVEYHYPTYYWQELATPSPQPQV